MTTIRRLAGKCTLLCLAMLLSAFAAVPLFGTGSAYAAALAPGGTVASNRVSEAMQAFDAANVSVNYENGIMTIALNDDIELEGPITFVQGAAADSIVLDLNGHSITGTAGVASTDPDMAKGQNALEFYPVAFDLEIRGPGSVIGGKGGIQEVVNTHYLMGMDGGKGVCINGPFDDEFYDRLEHGLKITGGALVKGGDGADITSAEWQYSFGSYAQGTSSNSPVLYAGDGGEGIGQPVAEIDPEQAHTAYARIDIIDGSVEGGAAGDVDMSGITPTVYALMNNSLSSTVMCSGNGGDGIRLGVGRKYVLVDVGGSVKGGVCSSVDFGSGKTYNRFGKNTADPGDGIAIYGDIGLTDDDVDFTSWQAKTQDSDDMGMYILGSVSGGDSPNAFALNEDAYDAGAGISLHGEMRYGNSSKWGIIDIEGSVTGGNAGSALSGVGGIGGVGIFEAYNKGDDQSYDSPYGTDHFIVNGTVSGGNGGSSYSNKEALENTVYSTSVYVPALSRVGDPGSGGSGLGFGSYRENVQVVGTGSVRSGNSGDAVSRSGAGVPGQAAAPIYVFPAEKISTFNVTTGTESGNGPQALSANRITVSAHMTSFSDQPTTNTQLSCTIDKPAGYTGPVYIQWVGVVFPIISYSGPDYTGFPCDIESSGTDYTSFKLLSNDAYGHLAYPTYPDHPEIGMYTYNYNIATTDRFSDAANKDQKKQIYCYVMLEDGSWGKSNVMEWTKGWTDGGSGGGDDGPSAADQAAADNVQGQINSLITENITLADADIVADIRAAYEALTDTQKALVDIALLEAAEAKIDGLNQTAADEVVSLIEQLPSAEAMAGMSPEELADAQTQIEAAIAAYNNLSDYQKSLIDSSYVTYLEGVMADYEAASGTTIDVEPIVPDNRVTLTASMVSVGNATYNGKAQKPAVTVKANGKTLKAGTDYTVAYKNNTNAGSKASVTVTGQGDYTGAVTKTFTINKAANPLVVKAKTATVKAKKVKKKTQTLKVGKVLAFSKKGQGTITYAKKSGNKKITINKKTGKVTAKKGLKKGTYKVKVAVKAAGNANYKAKTCTVAFKVKVK